MPGAAVHDQFLALGRVEHLRDVVGPCPDPHVFDGQWAVIVALLKRVSVGLYARGLHVDGQRHDVLGQRQRFGQAPVQILAVVSDTGQPVEVIDRNVVSRSSAASYPVAVPASGPKSSTPTSEMASSWA